LKVGQHGTASWDDFLRRYNHLKKQWFRPQRGGGGVDPDTGEVVVPLYTKEHLAKMFEFMGVEIPMTLDAEPEFIGGRKD
jgi:hypothetical protein